MKPTKRKRIVFGIDEGLPARVAASILRNQDFDLLAVHFHCDLPKLGEDPAVYPSAMRPSDIASLEKFAESLGVPFRAIDVTEEVLAKVYTPFFVATLNGARFAASPAWNREILFPKLVEIADARGAEAFGTGHFAGRAPDLSRYAEEEFDQSRSLARLDQPTLSRLVLPVGEVSVEMLMRLAREIGTSPKDDAPLGPARETEALREARAKRGVWEWTEAQLQDPHLQMRAAGDYFKPGPIGGLNEVAVGEHRGIPYYRVGSPAPFHDGHFVLDIRTQSRTVLIGPPSDLAVDALYVKKLRWANPDPRRAHRERRVIVEKEPPNSLVPACGPARTAGKLLEYPDGLAEIHLDGPLAAVAPGELLVFYEESRVLGSAIVAEVIRARPAEKAIESPASPA